ncbi:DUF5683 domain-containing protein [Porphyromonas bennonis]|uniref:DUF5683 domain-containing protein n=1 Tax=Porphyromonas bennonis TaxID=501496 RepID=UPI000ABD3E5A|nr:DUF5683 domain-containing protein [Porphyromonas bennonis]
MAYGSEAVGSDTIPTTPLQQDTTILTPTKADALAAQQDSARLIPTEVPVKAEVQKTFSPSPRAAVLWAIIPGGGQVYNRKYWKVPIIIGGMTALYYAISWNNNNLLEYAKAYSDIKSDDPMTNDSWIAFVPAGADPNSYRTNGSFQETLRHGRDFYRRNRDLSIIVSVGVYALSIIDAYVDAELAHFDISPELTLQATPTYIPSTTFPSSGGPAVQVALSF